MSELGTGKWGLEITWSDDTISTRWYQTEADRDAGYSRAKSIKDFSKKPAITLTVKRKKKLNR